MPLVGYGLNISERLNLMQEKKEDSEKKATMIGCFEKEVYMDLRRWLFEKDMKASVLAQKIGYSSVHVRSIARRRLTPSARLAKLIVEATDGEVTMEEMTKLEK